MTPAISANYGGRGMDLEEGGGYGGAVEVKWFIIFNPVPATNATMVVAAQKTRAMIDRVHKSSI